MSEEDLEGVWASGSSEVAISESGKASKRGDMENNPVLPYLTMLT